MTSVGKSLPHDSARGHVTGQALYLDDVSPVAGELQVGFVGSPVACGSLTGIDTAAALALPGVEDCFTAADIPGRNQFGTIVQDEPFLAAGELVYLGQPVAVVAARSQRVLLEGRRAVRISCEPHSPLLSIEEAILDERYLGPGRRLTRGDADRHLRQARHRLAGELRIGGQEQFYLESQAAIAYPAEENQLVVHASTQNPTEVQAVVAEVLGLGQHQVVCLCKRMGGAFGGKESQSTIPALMAALVALRTGRSARVIYSKDEDMRVTGKRHAYLARWEVGFDDSGRIEAFRCAFYSNGGAATDLSPAILERTLFHADNAYYLPHVELTGRICFTNLPPNTAFRGFGGPQAMVTIENIMETISQHLGMDALEVRTRNLYGVRERNTTPYGQVIEKNHLPEIIQQLTTRSHYHQRRQQVDRRNASSKTELHGLALTAMKFGIAFTSKFMNQANALVNVYTDGTVQISSGATEMGQGVNVKLRQMVADAFAIEADRVMVMPTSTEKNNNTSPTAASASADLNGAAALAACKQIVERLRGFAAQRLAATDPPLTCSPKQVVFSGGQVYDCRRPREKISFAQLCVEARRARIDLGARGYFATPGINFDRQTAQGTPFFYYTQGAAVAEVKIDRFTGTLRVSRVDLLIDIGRSINPGVDRGQIIGGFIQGMGWVTTEALVYDERGVLLSFSPTTYKIPAVTDLPDIFNVDTFDNEDNVQNVCRSKAVGEPPLMLGLSVWAAVKNALGTLSPGCPADLRLPATGEKILRCLTTGENRW